MLSPILDGRPSNPLGGRGVARIVNRSVSLVAHGVIGWAICGATIGLGRTFLSLPTTLVVHAIVAPLAFGALCWHYFNMNPNASPTNVALSFVTVVIMLDAGLVAPVFEHSYAMFRSPLGTWIPFALILAATYAVGRVRVDESRQQCRSEKSDRKRDATRPESEECL